MIILFLLGFSFPREYTRGVVQTIEASFCMDFCSMYYLDPDSGFIPTNLTTTPIIILEEYVGQHVEIWGEQTWCVECSALDVDEILLIQEPPPECTDNTNCGDCFDAGCFWQPVAPADYQCNNECFIMDTECYGQGSSWIAECPETEEPNCCDVLQLAEENCGGLGCFIPQCTDDCEWEPMQCWSSTGYCWCVDEDGSEIDGTSQPAWQGYPDCEEEITCAQGDLTNDYDVNVLDVVSMVNIILQLPSEDDPWNFWLCAGDLNGDGTINVLDVISLVNIILNPVSEDCLIIPEVGPCDGICPTYYYNQDSGQCEEFITGCCGIEAFDTPQSCEDICQ